MNSYIPKVAKIIDLIKHTEKEWTFRVECDTKNVLPGKFFEISMPKYGESPISVSGYGENYVDFTIRNVGKVTSERSPLTHSSFPLPTLRRKVGASVSYEKPTPGKIFAPPHFD